LLFTFDTIHIKPFLYFLKVNLKEKCDEHRNHESIYLKNENAITLLEQIALHKNEEIEVKLIGKNAFTSFILTEKSKQAFSETLELLNLLNV